MRLDLAAPRTVSVPVGLSAPVWRPWLEVTVCVRAVLEEWGLREERWLHWAAPLGADGRPEAGFRLFDPGLRAASEGEPPAEWRGGPGAVDRAAAEHALGRLLAGWAPQVHRSAELGLTSAVDEPLAAFRRRCLRTLAGAVRDGALAGDAGASAVARIAGSIETAVLAGERLELTAARAGVGWYPEGLGPGRADEDLMVAGGAGEGP